ncbi:unnamed protein product [Didymodactylos carnosus]|uniref:Uncharacterized protein n=1 Tax=Didymodactylos carnosus TaxID=1234261 RepID=A0A8S2D4H4_9BILA|nr:unnamed protein product [Didymodactylos carnosus]CAF3626077.1 unnamed protein product [Didymodactylos carnosus]
MTGIDDISPFRLRKHQQQVDDSNVNVLPKKSRQKTSQKQRSSSKTIETSTQICSSLITSETAVARRRSTTTTNTKELLTQQALTTTNEQILPIIYFGCEKRSGDELWDTTYFLSLLFELLDEYKVDTYEEYRLAAFIICRVNEIDLNMPIPVRIIIRMLKYFQNVRLKILILLELISVGEKLTCQKGLMLLWEFSSYGYMTLFYVVDRIKFSLVDKATNWKTLLSIFEPKENKKHAAYIILDENNFYKPNRASIMWGSCQLKRHF